MKPATAGFLRPGTHPGPFPLRDCGSAVEADAAPKARTGGDHRAASPDTREVAGSNPSRAHRRAPTRNRVPRRSSAPATGQTHEPGDARLGCWVGRRRESRALPAHRRADQGHGVGGHACSQPDQAERKGAPGCSPESERWHSTLASHARRAILHLDRDWPVSARLRGRSPTARVPRRQRTPRGASRRQLRGSGRSGPVRARSRPRTAADPLRLSRERKLAPPRTRALPPITFRRPVG